MRDEYTRQYLAHDINGLDTNTKAMFKMDLPWESGFRFEISVFFLCLFFFVSGQEKSANYYFGLIWICVLLCWGS